MDEIALERPAMSTPKSSMSVGVIRIGANSGSEFDQRSFLVCIARAIEPCITPRSSLPTGTMSPAVSNSMNPISTSNNEVPTTSRDPKKIPEKNPGKN
jgi:hypothetical protein